MPRIPRTARAAAFITILSLPLAAARADEGMWTFDAFPTAKMKADYGFAPDQAWLDRVRASAVRLTGGCSASFVSAIGLILTNHHCVASCLQDLSSDGSDYLKDGYIAHGRNEERLCPGQQAEVVTAIRDVSGAVKAAIGTASGLAAVKARTAAIARTEAAGCPDTATTRCQVVTLYGGGQYKLYTYRKYSDVRIVWAPESRAEQFGGDPDNFNFPRYALDGSFLRAYENGKPVTTPQHLTWAVRAPSDGEATFVVGNPGSTQRSQTGAQLAFAKEVSAPINVAIYSELRGRLIAAMAQSPERFRQGKEELDGVENSLKVYIGRVKAFNDPVFMGRIAAAEADLRAKSAGNAAIGDPWADAATAVAAYRDLYLPTRFIRPQGDLYGYASKLVRASEERAKPNDHRLPGYSDSALPLIEKQVLDDRPITPWVDQLMLEWSLSKAREYLGPDDADAKLMLGKESPEGLAARLVAGTRMGDPAYRKQLWVGGKAAVDASTDPMIVLARRLDLRDRALQALADERYDGPLTAARAKIADARFAAYGDTLYPDATFTLRISYGKVAGWNERGRMVPTRTLMGGIYDRATGAPPFDLPTAFVTNRARIDPRITYDFITTNDIIGGNSGSPVIDRSGAVIGAAFDGNIHSLAGNYGYDGSNNRTVAVSTAALEEALKHIYPAPALLAELHEK
ncbi:MAG: S46 family peptidase [Sphingomonas sp.]|uniref:S46 family peptidase n=1 Tax=Sphingomonas sp. TaxID=28214 RepID=UPI0017B4018B|nr:S46 family peptidase [Sphingomonas sp.]MBA3666832.1 S46 family peptidase [Sphingomonas sp.]